MINFLKKHFIPGPHNDHQPHFLRRKTVFFVLKLVLIIELLFLIELLWLAPFTNFFSAILSNVLVDLTNIDRQNNNLSILATNPLLEKAAELKANDMAQKEYFSHTSPDGKTPWEWLDDVGYKFKYAGENLAVNFFDSNDIEKAWMNSAGHKRNILSENFTEIGIATARGIYKGREAIFVVQYFGKPAKAKVVATTASLALENPFAKSSLIERAFVMPKTISTYIYLFIALIVAIALILKFFIKIKVQYPKLVFNGVIILFVIISVLYLNTLLIGQGYVF